MKSKSSFKSLFEKVYLPRVPTGVFDLTHDVKQTFSMGEIAPMCVMDCLPGDHFRITPEVLLRFAPLVAPIMHRVNVTTRYFFVPNRILWSEWENFITGTTEVEAPYIQVEDVAVGSLADYLGIPAANYTTAIRFSALAFAAYTKIYDEYYRDENLMSEEHVPLIPGDNSTSYGIWADDGPLRKAWKHDYLTSALPFAQKGSAVSVPLVTQDNIPVEFQANGNPTTLRNVNGTAANVLGSLDNESGPSPFSTSVHLDFTAPVAFDPNGTLVVDVQADATDINTLRRAYALQRFLERDALGGTRYTEKVRAHFDVRSSDARMQRPELIGTSRGVMAISEVLATAQNSDPDSMVAVGEMAGHGISASGGQVFDYYCEEHGFILGFVTVEPTTAYQNGLPKMHSRYTPLDYAWPSFQHIGEQEIKNIEVYANSSAEVRESIFGYIPRYAEYMFMNSRVAASFRTSGLDVWHLGRIFSTAQSLNAQFVTCNPDTRIFAVTDPSEDHIYSHIFNHCRVVRKLSQHSTPI